MRENARFHARTISGIVHLLSVLAVIFVVVFFSGFYPQKNSTSSAVLAESDGPLRKESDGAFIVNVPMVLNGDVDGKGHTINLGDGTIIAKNIISELLQGTGLAIIAGDDRSYTLVNADPGSAQRTFGTVSIDGNTIAADTNEDTLEFEAGEGLELSVENGKIIIKSKSGSGSTTNNYYTTNTGADTSGFVDKGNTISLKTPADNVALGTDVAQGKLTVQSSSKSQEGIVIQALEDQTAALLSLRDATGSALIEFDASGNAVFKGNVTQTGNTKIIGGGLTFNSTDPIIFDGVGEEPGNLLSNGQLETDYSGWTASSPTVTEITTNNGFATNTSGWTGSLVSGSTQELFQNTGVESNLSGWDISGGGLHQITEYAVPGTLTNPVWITNGPDGSMYFTANGSSKVGKITTGGVISEVGATFASPWQIVTGPDGALWVTTVGSGYVGRITTTGIFTQYSTAASTFGITNGPDGNIWYGTSSSIFANAKVGKITTGGVKTEYGPIELAMRSLTVGSDNNLWIIPFNTTNLYRVTPAGNVTTFTTPSTGKYGITTASDGTVWYTSSSVTKVGKVAMDGTVTEYTVPNGQMGITAGEDGAVYYAAFGGKRIGRVNIVTGTAVEYGPTTGQPRGLVKGPDGNIWFASMTPDYIGKLQIVGPEHVSTPTFSLSAGAMHIPASSQTTQITQSVNVGSSSNQYALSVYAYIDETTPVTDQKAVILANGTTIATTYEAVGGGWYKLSGTFTGSASLLNYGLLVQSNTNIYLDNFSLKQVPAGWSSDQYYPGSNIGSARVAAPSSTDVLFVQQRSLLAGGYTLRAYAYTNGTAVSASDIQLSIDGTALSTVYAATATPGWYQLTAAASVNSAGLHSVGALIKSNKTVYIDTVSLMPTGLGQVVTHHTSGQNITYASSQGAVGINAIGATDVTFSQSVTVDMDGTYVFVVHAYNDTPGYEAAAITSNNIELSINGVPTTATYAVADDDFSTVQAQTPLNTGVYTLALTVKSGSRLVIDSLALQKGSGTDRTFRVLNSGTGLAFLDVESTIFANSGKTDKSALIITSAASQTANLTEWKDFDGNVLGVIDEAGRIAVGSSNPSHSLEVVESSTQHVVAFLNRTTDDSPQAGVLRLALGVATDGVDSRYMQFYAGATTTSNGTGVGRIRLNNGGVAYESGGADFAEYFTTDDASRYQPGDVVMLATSLASESTGLIGRAVKAEQPYAPTILGVVSDTAAFVGNAKETDATDSARIIVGLTGQMTVNVSTISGTIKAGDLVTSSSITGIAQKATKPGMTLGIALEDIPVSTTEARVFVRPAWNAANPTTEPWYASGEASMQDMALLQDSQIASGESVLDKLTVLGKVNASELYATDSIGTGLLTLESLNSTDSNGNSASSIDTITGTLLLQSHTQGEIELMGGRTVIDKLGNLVLKQGDIEVQKGVFKGNNTFTGIAVLNKGETSVHIDRQWKTVPQTILANPKSNTDVNWAIENDSPHGFDIRIREKQATDTTFYWFAIFGKEGEE